MFIFTLSVLFDSEDKLFDGVLFVLRRLKECGRKVVVCGVGDDSMAAQQMVRAADLVDLIDYYFYEIDHLALKERILSSVLVQKGGVLLGASVEDKILARDLDVRFCLATYCTCPKDYKDELDLIEMVSSPKKLLAQNGIFREVKTEPRDYAIEFVSFSSPVASPLNFRDKKKIYLPLAEVVTDEASNIKVLHVRDFITLVQAIDKIKYVGGLADTKVYLRGQSSLYTGQIMPSAYRHGDKSSVDKKIVGLIEMLKDVAGDEIRKLSDDVIEGLFQQYEQSSRWVDAVDNIWVALWFACHRRWEQCDRVSYVPRNPRIEQQQYRYCYVLILGADSRKVKLMDLRVVTPSIFVRPHAQHGVLLQKTGRDGLPTRDMSSMIRGVVRIDLEDALSWIGSSPSLSASVMFPNPSFDSGFKNLIEDGLKMKTGLVFK